MTSISVPATGASGLGAMAGIEARRLARHPVFLVGVGLALVVQGLIFFLDDAPRFTDVLSMPVVPAFFIGLTSLVATARLTRSTEAAVEAVATAPGTEARRTLALVIACLVPFAAGVVCVLVMLAMAAAKPPAPQEWWFGTMPDWQVWSILVALAPVACLGGGLLGVLTGRWLRFPGAAAVVVVGLVALDIAGQMGIAGSDNGHSVLRLWVPWAMFHSGSNLDGTQDLGSGNPFFYLVYLLCLCAAAALVAVWHDRTARTRQLQGLIAGVVVVGLAALVLAMTTGAQDPKRSDPISYRIDK